jgi:hypothetical protein
MERHAVVIYRPEEVGTEAGGAFTTAPWVTWPHVEVDKATRRVVWRLQGN